MLRSRGLTLVEILLCCLILSIAILSLAFLFIRGLQLQGKSTEVLQASQLAQQLLERIRRLPPEVRPVNPNFAFDGRMPAPAVGGFPPSPYPQWEADSRRYFFRVTGEAHAAGPQKLKVEVFFQRNRVVVETLLAP